MNTDPKTKDTQTSNSNNRTKVHLTFNSIFQLETLLLALNQICKACLTLTDFSQISNKW